jgi:hypothetical protein
MRIHVTGECPAAKALRGYLCKHDFHLTAHEPDWVVHIEELEEAAGLVIDGAGGELEQAVLRHVRKLTAIPIEIRTARTVSGDREIRILVPPREADRKAIETAVFRGLLELAKQALIAQASPWWKTILQGISK